MSNRGKQVPSTGPTWEQELYAYLDGIIAKRLAEREAAARGESVAEAAVPAEAPVPAEAAEVVGVTPAGTAEPLVGAAPGDGIRLLFGLLPTPSGETSGGSAPASQPPGAPIDRLQPASSGVKDLDTRLGGGFFPGLWMVSGRPGSGKTAFLENVAWETFTNGRPVIYYSLTDGADVVRERFLDILAFIMADRPDSGVQPDPDWRTDPERRAALNRMLRQVVLSRMWIVDSFALSPDPIGAFFRGLERALEGLSEQTSRTPVVLIDDLRALRTQLRAESASNALRVVTGLDASLMRRGSPGLAVFPELSGLVPPEEEAKNKGLVHLGHGRVELWRRSAERVDLAILDNPHAAWRGTLPLVIHPAVSMFTLAV